MSTWDFATGCALCHPGGGELEYGRETLDSGVSYPNYGFTNETRGDYNFILTKASPYWFFKDYNILIDGTNGNPRGGSLLLPTKGTASGTGNDMDWYSKPAFVKQEVDCMMCHFQNDGSGKGSYKGLDRAYGVRKVKGAWGPSIGLSGLSITTNNDPNPQSNLTGLTGAPSSVDGTTIGKPTKEACSICHNADGKETTAREIGYVSSLGESSGGCSSGVKCDKAGKYSFIGIRYMGAAYDSDDRTGAPGTCPSDISGNITNYTNKVAVANDCANDKTWWVPVPRSDLGKRAGSINNDTGWMRSATGTAPYGAVGGEKDVHMDATLLDGTGGAAGTNAYIKDLGNMSCVNCHYNYEGAPTEPTTAAGIYSGWPNIQKMDHQFAKGNSTPDGKNMDNIDNTLTCEMCHIDQTHPGLQDGTGANTGKKVVINAANQEKVVKVPTHASLGDVAVHHLDRIDCKTCHIPYLKPARLLSRDFLLGPWRLTTRDQKQKGLIYPAYVWRNQEYHGARPGIDPVPTEGWKIHPVFLESNWIWANYTDVAQDKFSPIYTRVAYNAAEANSKTLGWNLNGNDNGFLMMNTASEIAAMATSLQAGATGVPAVSEPVANLYLNVFGLSHKVKPKEEALGYNGCTDCHSSTSKILNQTVTLFYPVTNNGDDCASGICGTQNSDGLQMTCAGGDCSTGTKRLRAKLSFKDCDGDNIPTIDLGAGKSHGQAIGNSVTQQQLLGGDLGTNCVNVASLNNFATMLSTRTCATCHAEVSYHATTNTASIKTPAAFDTNGCKTCHVGGIGTSGVPVQTGNYEPHHSPAAPLATVDVANTCGYCHGTDGATGTHNGAPAHTLAQLTDWAAQIHQSVIDQPPTISLGACSVNSCTGLATIYYAVTDGIDLRNMDVTWGTSPVSSLTFPGASDTSSLPGATVTHTYSTNGTFNVTGTVYDSIGQSAVATTTCTRVAPSNYSITVTVKNHAGTLNAATAKVVLKYSNGTTRTGYTGTNGQYTFGNVPDCTSYTITVTKAGWTFTIPAASGTISGANASHTINANTP